MEIADVFVVNKADREGVERTARDLQSALEIDEEMGAWLPPIVKTVASLGRGIEDVLAAVDRHRAHLVESGELAERRRDHLRLRVEMALKARVLAAASERLELQAEIERAFAEKVDPYTVAERVFASVTRLGGEA